MLPARSRAYPWAQSVALIAGVACLIAGAARPRWGVYFEEVQSRGVDMFILLDVSRSMLAEDAAPNRLARARAEIASMLDRLRGHRVGLIAFAGKAAVLSPLTPDYGFFRMMLRGASPSSVSPRSR